MNERVAPGADAFALMVLLCSIWGMQQVAVKLALEGVSPILQAGLRSAVATLLLLAWAGARRMPLTQRDGTWWSGCAAGVLFGLEFIFIYVGLGYSSASRLVVFLYTAPCFTVLGLHLFVPGERIGGRHALGVGLAFCGMTLAFVEGWNGGGHWFGDVCGLLAAIFWAANTVLVRATGLARVSATKALLYQLAVSAVLLIPLSVVSGESGVTELTPTVWISLVFQGAVVAFASYLAWYWMLTRYLANRLMVFSFLTPLFGVGFGVILLGERFTTAFGFAAALVGIGIVMVNLSARKA